jgi:predicted esterase
MSDLYHIDQPVLSAGVPVQEARAVMILLHGRGGSAADILSLAEEIDIPQIAYVAPQAASHSWYPFRFFEATARNEPWLSSALHLVDRTVEDARLAGLKDEKIGLLGFSQGGCLALEYAARNSRRWGGVVGLSGALIGADKEPRIDRGNLAGTPVFLGCSDVDFHIPLTRVQNSSDILEALGGEVTFRIYPGMGHTINRDEIRWVRELLIKLSE